MFITKYNTQEYQVFRFSKTQAISVCHASDEIKTQIKLLALKTWYPVIIEHSRMGLTRYNLYQKWI